MAISTIGASGLDSTVSQIGKNLIHNGAMTVSQRGASATALTGNSLTQLDRWRFWENSAAEYTTAQSTTVPSGEAFATSIEIAVTTVDTSIAAGDFNILEYRFEGRDVQHLAYNTASAKTLTASFWIRSTKTGVMGCYMYQVDGDRSYVREITINTTNTWEFKTVTFPGDTAGGTAWANDSTVGGAFGICLDGGSTYQVAADAWAANQDFTTSNQMNGSDNTSNKVYVTGVQLEVGSVATDFEHEPISVTMAKCQRYFNRITGEEDNDSVAFYGSTDTDRGTSFFHTVPMRASPTASLGGTVPNMPDCAGTITSINAAQDDHEHQIQMIHWIVSSATDNQVSRLRFATADTDFIQFSAEL